MTTEFPNTFDFAGYNAPSRVECEIHDLVVEGQLPGELAGSWYRSIPDPQYPPMLGHDTYLSGDGMVSVFEFKNGRVDFRQRYVETERFKAERKAGRSLFGSYRNPHTDDPSVRGVNRGVNNTTPLWHGGRLLALKEDSRAVELHPRSLETLGVFDFEGKLRSQTMTAHPRRDPVTGELLFFGYEAAGLATRDIAFCIADKHGKLVREEWFEAPYVSMMHDFAATKEHVIFPVFPTTADRTRLEAGGAHWIYEPQKEVLVGIMPRDGSVKHMRWFRRPGCSAYHFMNAFSEGGWVHLFFTVNSMNPFAFIREASGIHVQPQDMVGNLVRWSFDMTKPGDRIEEHIIGPGGDMPRIADKDALVDFEVGYYQLFDPKAGPPLMVGPVGAGFNTIARVELKTGKLRTYVPGPGLTVQEHLHIASNTPGHEGYLAFVVDNHQTWLSEAYILEAGQLERGPIAKIKLPLRLRCGVHGNWVRAEDF